MILEETDFVWLMWGMKHKLFLLYKVCVVEIISTRYVMGKNRPSELVWQIWMHPCASMGSSAIQLQSDDKEGSLMADIKGSILQRRKKWADWYSTCSECINKPPVWKLHNWVIKNPTFINNWGGNTVAEEEILKLQLILLLVLICNKIS